MVTSQSPVLTRAPLRGKLVNGQWNIIWDRDTGVASRVFGTGIDVPGSIANPAIALSAARALLAEQIDILAPGADPSEFELAANHLFDGIRTIGFIQRHRGIRVVGGQVSFRFKNDRLVVFGSEALPHVTTSSLSVTPAVARTASKHWIDGDFQAASHVGNVGAAVILPIVSTSGHISFHTVVPVTVSSMTPVGKWTVYVADGGKPVARRQLLKFADGVVNYRVNDRWPGGTQGNYPASFATVSVDGANQTANLAGSVTFNGNTAAIGTGVTGQYVRVPTDQGGDATSSFTLADGGSVLWDENASEFLDAQLTTFIHSNIAKAYARVLNPGLPWLDQNMRATVNIADTCNAFSDGDSINFFQGNNQCGNTGRLADVVYHEFGHSFHANSVIPGVGSFDGAFSEGLSDYYAATITNDPAMGVGFFNSTAALRHMDQQDFVWPRDIGGVHQTGRIFAGAMWDLRKALVAELGAEAGKAEADRLFYAAVQRASNIPSTFVEILIADDDDGNLANGTPRQCMIEETFGLHGLASSLGGVAPGLQSPVRDLYTISVPVLEGGNSACPAPAVTAMNIVWRLRGESADQAPVAMALEANMWNGTLPTQPDGAIVEYRIEATYADSEIRSLPTNEADPYYEFYNGETVELYCAGFETLPADWTLGAQWESGSPAGNIGSGNPDSAYSGSGILATSLAGKYRPDSNVVATMPSVDVSGHENVRLHFRRWLGVEDSVYDQAIIHANGAEVWKNASNGEDLAHEDREWRFKDVALTPQVSNGTVTVDFQLRTDPGLEFAGWALDDVCIVGAVASVCGDGSATGNEACDLGSGNSDSEPDGCRSDCSAATCGDGVTDSGEQCDDGNDIDDDNCSNVCLGEGDGGGCGCQSSSGGGSGAFLFAILIALGYIRRNRKRPTA